eukprot:TRINITY_DN1363_c0_g6_i1.p1 TRINITY_DN1363_c0_g6~~TRINITY_DN1363_c0_g6_i1.p1  ORF type:complete len:545 (+),score=189.43 TRINITY_DN1363_c0_g6_i1:52-1686(+)
MRRIAACVVLGTAAADLCQMAKGPEDRAYARQGQSCEKMPCVNGDVRNDVFQPSWYDGERHHAEEGLYCHPTKKVCLPKLGDWETGCEEHFDCQSHMCYLDITKTGTAKRCIPEGGLKGGETCPTQDLHLACAGNARCVPADVTKAMGSVPYVCQTYDEEDHDCHNIYEPSGQTVAGHTCDPAFGALYCENRDLRGAPGALKLGEANTYARLLRVGRCRTLEDHGRKSDQSCKYFNQTNSRPDCNLDQFCKVHETDAKKDHCVDTLSDDEGNCTSHAACEYGALCNITVLKDGKQQGTCMEMFEEEVGAYVFHSDLCEVGLYRNEEGKCDHENVNAVCRFDKDCKGRHMYCDNDGDNTEGKCASWLPMQCDEEYENFAMWARQSQRGQNFFTSLLCDREGCGTRRYFDSKVKRYASKLTCCLWDERDKSSCLSLKGERAYYTPFVQPDYSVSFRASDLEGNEADICSSSGLSLLEIIVIVVICVCCVGMCVFVLVKELILYEPEEEDDAEKKGTAYATGEDGEVSPVEMSARKEGDDTGREPVY